VSLSRLHPCSIFYPYTTLFRSIERLLNAARQGIAGLPRVRVVSNPEFLAEGRAVRDFQFPDRIVIGANDTESAAVLANLYAPFRSEEHTSELQSRENLVCRLLL